jgi:DNA-directed RNA polymerase sigma subunit (sigma70/sigma32)
MRFGLYGDNGLRREYKVNEIGDAIGLTSERVRQLELKAMKTLKEEYKNRIKDF